MTKLLTEIENILHGKTASGIEHYLVTLGSASLKIAATSPLGVAILGAIKAGEAGGDSVQKIGLAIAALVPYLTSEKPGALVADVETTARILIEGVLAQIKSTGPLVIFETLASLALAAA